MSISIKPNKNFCYSIYLLFLRRHPTLHILDTVDILCSSLVISYYITWRSDDYLVIWVGFHLTGMPAQHTVGLVGKVFVTEHHHLLKFRDN